MNEVKDIKAFLDEFIANITPENDVEVLERERKLQEKNVLLIISKQFQKDFIKNHYIPIK